MRDQQSTLREAMKRLDLTRDGVRRAPRRRRAAPSTRGCCRRPPASTAGMPAVVAKLLAGLPRGRARRRGRTPRASLRARFTKRGKPHLLSVAQFDRDAVESLLRVAEAMEPIARRRKVTRVLEGAVLGNLFFEPSTRTRVSFGAAFCRLGGSVCDTTGFTFSSMVKGESIADTSRVISGYVDAIVVRHPEQGSVARVRAPHAPAGDQRRRRHRRASRPRPSSTCTRSAASSRAWARASTGRACAMVGDLRHGRTVHSLIRLLSLYRGLTLPARRAALARDAAGASSRPPRPPATRSSRSPRCADGPSRRRRALRHAHPEGAHVRARRWRPTRPTSASTGARSPRCAARTPW